MAVIGEFFNKGEVTYLYLTYSYVPVECLREVQLSVIDVSYFIG